MFWLSFFSLHSWRRVISVPIKLVSEQQLGFLDAMKNRKQEKKQNPLAWRFFIFQQRDVLTQQLNEMGFANSTFNRKLIDSSWSIAVRRIKRSTRTTTTKISNYNILLKKPKCSIGFCALCSVSVMSEAEPYKSWLRLFYFIFMVLEILAERWALSRKLFLCSYCYRLFVAIHSNS